MDPLPLISGSGFIFVGAWVSPTCVSGLLFVAVTCTCGSDAHAPLPSLRYHHTWNPMSTGPAVVLMVRLCPPQAPSFSYSVTSCPSLRATTDTHHQAPARAAPSAEALLAPLKQPRRAEPCNAAAHDGDPPAAARVRHGGRACATHCRISAGPQCAAHAASHIGVCVCFTRPRVLVPARRWCCWRCARATHTRARTHMRAASRCHRVSAGWGGVHEQCARAGGGPIMRAQWRPGGAVRWGGAMMAYGRGHTPIAGRQVQGCDERPLPPRMPHRRATNEQQMCFVWPAGKEPTTAGVPTSSEQSSALHV